MSDLHDDHWRRSTGEFRLPDDVEADVCVVAGDVAGRLSRMGRTWLEHSFRGIPIVAVPGNHDFWGASLDTEVRKFKDRLSVDFLHLLDGEELELSGVRFVGATLWTDYALGGSSGEAMLAADGPEGMNDFRRIRTSGGTMRLRPRHLLDLHLRERKAIDDLLAVPFSGPSVVVSHHAPHASSLRRGLVDDGLDSSYASDLTDLIVRRSPALWVHGHVHERRDYRVHSTRIICNPRGYPVSRAGLGRSSSVLPEHDGFDPRLVVEV